MPVRLVDCGRERAPHILAIINEAIENSTAIYDYKPRTMPMMDAWFDAKERAGYPVIGAVDDAGRLLGFATFSQFRERPAYKYAMEHSVYVNRDCRGRGIGRELLAAIIDRARGQGVHVLIAGIDAENAVSIELHRRFGFVFCGEVREVGFKFGRWLDLQFYQLILETPARPSTGEARHLR